MKRRRRRRRGGRAGRGAATNLCQARVRLHLHVRLRVALILKRVKRFVRSLASLQGGGRALPVVRDLIVDLVRTPKCSTCGVSTGAGPPCSVIVPDPVPTGV